MAPRDWHFKYLEKTYFAPIFRDAKQVGVWPLKTVWTGKQGVPYRRKQEGRDVNPHWMIEDVNGRRRTDRRLFRVEDSYEETHMYAWTYDEIARYFGIVL